MIDRPSLSTTYKIVLEHRRNCPKWTKGFCLECFGGGLTRYVEDLNEEIRLKM